MGWPRCNAGQVPVASSLFLGSLLTRRRGGEVVTSGAPKGLPDGVCGRARSRRDAVAAGWQRPTTPVGGRGCGIDGSSSDRSPRSRRRVDCARMRHRVRDNVRTIAGRIDAQARNASKWSTCSIVISRRRRWKSMPGTVCPSFHGETGGLTTGPFRSLSYIGERGTALCGISRGVANRSVCGGRGQLAPATPTPHPGVRS